MTKLSPEQIQEARELHAAGSKYGHIAERFGVDRQTIKRALDPEYRALRCKQIRLTAVLRRPWRALARNRVAEPVRFVDLSATEIHAALRGD